MEEGALTQSISRRKVLNWFLGTTGGAFIFSVLYPLGRYLIPPKAEESAAHAVTLSINAKEIKPNSGQVFRFGNRPGILISTPTGELRAFAGICTHLDCTVQYRADINHIWCACHNGHFDLTGKNIEGPPPRPLESYTVSIRGNEIVVSKRT